MLGGELTPESIHQLQRLAGNSSLGTLLDQEGDAVQRAPAAPAAAEQHASSAPAQGPARPYIGPEQVGIMRAEVSEIVGMLQEMWLSAGQEQRIVEIVESYAHLDEAYQAQTGYTGTDQLDRFLLLLKTSSYQHATFASLGVAQTYSTYDQLFRELKESRLDRFKSVVARSRKQATSGPEEPAPEGFDWAKLGKQEGMGVWGILKGISSGLGKLLDAGTDVVNWLPKKLGYDLKPLNYSELIGDQFDEAGDAMFGSTWKKRKKPGEAEPHLSPEERKRQEEEDKENELFLGINPQQLGTAGGDVVFSLAMMSGGGAAGGTEKMRKGFKYLVKAKEVAKGLEEIYDKSQEMFDVATAVAYEVRKEKGEDAPFIPELVARAEFQVKVWELSAAIVETILAGAADKDETTELVKKFIVTALKGNITMAKGAQVIQIANDEKLTPEERKKATGEALLEFIKTGYLLLGGFAAKRDEKNAEAEAERKRQAELAASVARQQNEPHMRYNEVELEEGGPPPELASKPGAKGGKGPAGEEPGAAEGAGSRKSFNVDDVLVDDKALSGGFKESVLKKIAMENWKREGNELVKVVSTERGQSGEVKGYVTEQKYIAGRTPAEMERVLGLPDGELAGGAIVHRLADLPTADQFKLRAYTQLPAGRTYVPGEKYPPGLGAPQWELTAKIPVKAATSVNPDERYRPGGK